MLDGNTNLITKKRKQMGCIAKHNKFFVNKAYMEEYAQPTLSFISKKIWPKYFASCKQIELRLMRVNIIVEQTNDSKILLYNDIYNNSPFFTDM